MKRTILLLICSLLVLNVPSPAIAATPDPVLVQIPLCGMDYTPKYDGDFPEFEKWDGFVNTQVYLLNAGRFIVTATLTVGTLVRITGCVNGNEPSISPDAYYQVSVLDGRFVGLTGWVRKDAVSRK